MKRTLEADEARLKLVLERKELDKKGKGRAKDDVVGVPTEFGGQGGGEAGMFLKRRKVSGSRGPPPPSSSSSSPEEAARATTVGGDETVDLPPPVEPPAAVPPDPSLPPPTAQPSWFGTWTRSASGMAPPASSSPTAVASASPPFVQPPQPPSPPTDARAAAPPTTTPAAPLATTSDASDPAPAGRPPATGSGVAASVAAQAISWIPKPVVSTVAALPGVRSYVAGSSNGPSPPPAPKPSAPVEPVPKPAATTQTISTSPVEVDRPGEALMSSAAIHEGHLPGAPTPASWFWPASSARAQPAGPEALPAPGPSDLKAAVREGLPATALSEFAKEPQGGAASTPSPAAPPPAQSWWGYVPFVGDAPVGEQADAVAKEGALPSLLPGPSRARD